MTDQNNRRSASTKEEDPLEELARIVSGDLGETNRSPNETGTVTVDSPKSPRDDSFAADLEAELARELFGDEDDDAEAHSELAQTADTEIADEELPEEPVIESPPVTAAEPAMSLEDQLMAELENRAARHQQYKQEQAISDLADENADSEPVKEISPADAEPRLGELEVELEEYADSVGSADDQKIALDFEGDISQSDPYARQLDENLRSVAAGELAARASRQKAAAAARDVTPPIDRGSAPQAHETDVTPTPFEDAPHSASLDLSDAFRAELEQIEDVTHRRQGIDVSHREESELPEEIDSSDAFAMAFERELRDESPESTAGTSMSAARTPDWADDDTDEQPGPPPVMRHLQSEESSPVREYREYSDEELFDEVERQPETDEIEEFEAQRSDRKRRSGMRLAAAAFLVALLAGGGVIAYGYLFDTAQVSGEPPIIRADTEPVKVRPDDPGGATIDNQDKAAYEQVTGSFAKETSQEQLVTTAEEPIDIGSIVDDETVTESATGVDGDDPGPPMITEENTGERLEDPVVNGSATAMLAPRKVRAVVVKPDGTIVPPQQDSLSIVPLATSLAAQEGTVDGARSTGQIAVPVPRPELDTGVQNTDDGAAQDLQSLASTASAAEPEAAAAGAASGLATGSDAWAVQVASRRSAEEAQQTFQAMRRDYPALFQDKEMAVQRAEIDGRGTFYRVRVLAESRDEAVDLCTRLKSAGGSCFVTR